ncbi:MAG: toxin-antitoxin system HicB family antitoxin [Candidatus Saccharibacteria bacterium]|nr:toxin-antitoxin system HicB family antitoxin [Rhodoferax sp.]
MASPGKKAYPLRIDPALWATVERLAAQELRSANAQVEFLLREGLERRGRLPLVVPDDHTKTGGFVALDRTPDMANPPV